MSYRLSFPNSQTDYIVPKAELVQALRNFKAYLTAKVGEIEAEDIMNNDIEIHDSFEPAEDVSMSEIYQLLLDNVPAPAPVTSSTKFSELPPDVLHEILIRTGNRDLYSVAQVSKGLREAASENILWYKRYVEKFGEPSETQLKILRKRFPRKV